MNDSPSQDPARGPGDETRDDTFGGGGVDDVPTSEFEDAERRAVDEAILEELAEEVEALDEEPAVLLEEHVVLAKERDEYLRALQLLQADFENYRKRVARLQEEQTARAALGLVTKVLPVIDTLDLAAAHVRPGEDGDDTEKTALAQARSMLIEVLSKEGLERVDEAEVAFDPVVHDAVAHAPAADGELGAQVVEEVMRAGYRWQGQVIRPAMVRVRG
jgi:molecular chaperone GrpE